MSIFDSVKQKLSSLLTPSQTTPTRSYTPVTPPVNQSIAPKAANQSFVQRPPVVTPTRSVSTTLPNIFTPPTTKPVVQATQNQSREVFPVVKSKLISATPVQQKPQINVPYETFSTPQIPSGMKTSTPSVITPRSNALVAEVTPQGMGVIKKQIGYQQAENVQASKKLLPSGFGDMEKPTDSSVQKFLKRTGTVGLQAATNAANFFANYILKNPDKLTPMGFIQKPDFSFAMDKNKIDAGKKLKNEWSELIDTVMSSELNPSKKVVDAVNRLSQAEYMQPDKEWEAAPLKEKLGKRLPQTLVEMGPGALGSMVPFFLGGGVGTLTSIGSTADDVKKTALKYGADNEYADTLAIGTGVIAGWLDKIVPDEVLGKEKQKFIGTFTQKLAKKIFDTAKIAGKEAATEIAQEDVQLLAESTVRDDIGADEIVSRNALSGVMGAFGGAGFKHIADLSNAIADKKIPAGLSMQDVSNGKPTAKGEEAYQRDALKAIVENKKDVLIDAVNQGKITMDEWSELDSIPETVKKNKLTNQQKSDAIILLKRAGIDFADETGVPSLVKEGTSEQYKTLQKEITPENLIENEYEQKAIAMKEEPAFKTVQSIGDGVVDSTKKYKTTVNIQDKNDLEYLRRILSEDNIRDIQNGKMTNFRGTPYEDLARVNLISETPKTIEQQLEGKIKNIKLKSNVFYHGTSSENALGIITNGFKTGSSLPENISRGGGYGKMQNSISFAETPKEASIFSKLYRNGEIVESKLKDNAKVVSIDGIQDALELEDYIKYLKSKKIDAVYIGGGEKEIVVINPKAVKPIKSQPTDSFENDQQESYRRPSFLDEVKIPREQAIAQAKEIQKRLKLTNIDNGVVDIILTGDGDEAFGAALGNQIFFTGEVPQYTGIHETIHIIHNNVDSIELFTKAGITKEKLDAELKRFAGTYDIREILAENGELRADLRAKMKEAPTNSIMVKFFRTVRDWFKRVFAKENKSVVGKFLDIVEIGKAQKETFIPTTQKELNLKEIDGKRVLNFEKQNEQPSYIKMEPSKAAELEYQRSQNIEQKQQTEIQKEEEILNARYADLEFDNSEREYGYQTFKKLASRRSVFEAEDSDQLKALLAKRPDFGSEQAVGDRLFQGADELTDDELLDIFKQRFNEENRLKELAKQKTPSELLAAEKKSVEKVVKKEIVGKNLPIKQVILPPAKKATKELTTQQFYKQQEKTARVASIAARNEERQNILEKLKIKEQDRNQIKTEIVAYIKSSLPVSEQGRFISLVKNTNTQKDLIGAFLRVEQHREAYELKQAISELKRMVNKLSESPSIDVEYAKKIKEVVSNFELTGHREETIQKLKSIERYIETKRNSGEDVFMPEEVLEKLQILKRIPKDQLTIDQVNGMIQEVELLARLGATKLASREALYDAQKEKRKEILLQRVVKFSTLEEEKAEVGNKLKATQKVMNKMRSAYNTLVKKNWSITPMDGVAKLTGMEPVKATLDLDYANYLNHELKTSVIDKRVEIIKRNKLEDTNMERIGVYAMLQQDGGLEKLNNLGITEEQARRIKLTEGEMEYYQFVRKVFDDAYAPVKKYMKEVYNKDVGQVKNYVSFVTDYEAMNDLEIYDRFGTLAEETIRTKKVNEGFAKSRVGAGDQKVQLNIDKIFLRHTDDVAYMVTMGKDIKMLTEIVNSKEMKESMGDLSSLMWKEYLDLMARKGGTDGAKKIKAFDIIRKNLGASVLSFKLSSALVQLTSLTDAASVIGGTNILNGTQKIVTSKKWRKFVLDNFPEIRTAIGDDVAFTELSDNLFGRIGKAGFVPLQKLDGLVRSSTAVGAYIQILKAQGKQVDLSNPDKAALLKAQAIVRKTQGSSSYKDQPLALTKGTFSGNKSFDKLFFQFQSFVLHRWDNIKDQLYREGFKKIGPSQGIQSSARGVKSIVNGAFWLLVVSSALESVLREASKGIINLLTGQEEEDKEKKGLVKSVLLNTVQSIPVLGSIMNAVLYQSNPVPAIKTIEDAIKGTSSIATGKEANTKIGGAARVMGSIGALSGVPGSIQGADLFKKFLTREEKKPSKVKVKRIKPRSVSAKRIKRVNINK